MTLTCVLSSWLPSLHIDRPAQFVLKHEFIKELHKRYQAEGIYIEYPVRKVLFGNTPPAQGK
jgi:small-conductance mechanosensitive channel